ncbi:hypothetical protein F2P81_014364 [Scophthalmus maximus]|uniref:Uncharacterized protein n=1 Tax=Scophthalmus maximus TaxID=52904 RepID=A0A6A4SQC0_SCOMX|nr:hypothetical protein F2P81_014364 [Scophthalmus maximus]
MTPFDIGDMVQPEMFKSASMSPAARVPAVMTRAEYTDEKQYLQRSSRVVTDENQSGKGMRLREANLRTSGRSKGKKSNEIEMKSKGEIK